MVGKMMERLPGTIAAIVGILLVTASAAKATSFEDAAAALGQTNLFPSSTNTLILGGLCIAEMGLGLALIFPATRKLAYGPSSVLLAMFAGYSVFRLSKGLTVPCSCFGAFLKIPAGQMACLSSAMALSLLAFHLNAKEMARPSNDI